MFKFLIAVLLLTIPSSAFAQAVVRVTSSAQHPYKHRPADLSAIDTPADNECVTYDSASGQFEWATCGGGGGGTPGGNSAEAQYNSSGSFAGLPRSVMTSSGNFGIGTTSTPTALLQASSTLAQDLFLVEDNGIGDSTSFLINQNGNVGVGTIAPTVKLHLQGGGADSFRIDKTAGDTTPILVDSNGNLGIGLTTVGNILSARRDQNAETSVIVNNTTNGASAVSSFVAGSSSAGTDFEFRYQPSNYVGASSGWANKGVIYAGNATSGVTFVADGTGNGFTWENNGRGVANQKMALTSGGNLGINSTAPGTKLDVAGAVSADQGSAALPGYEFTQDRSTGVYLPAAGNLGVSISGVERVRVGSGGNVGIGTIDVSKAKMTIGGGLIAATGASFVTDTSAQGVGSAIFESNVGIGTWSANGWPLKIRRAGGVGALGVSINNCATCGATRDGIFAILPDVPASQTGGYYFQTWNGASGSVDALSINAAGNVGIGTTQITAGKFQVTGGNVGIGTTTTAELVHIEQNTSNNTALVVRDSFSSPTKVVANLIRLNNQAAPTPENSALIVNDHSSNNTAWFTNNSGGNIMLIKGNGNIGIGTNDPIGKLIVTGGNVGIGTVAPVAPLNIYAAASGQKTYLALGIGANDLDTRDIDFITVGGSSGVGARIGGQRTSRAVAGDSDLYFSTRSNSVLAERVRILDNGNVGVGTSLPGGKLVVVGGNVGVGTITPQGAFVVTSGNVGIGTWAPAGLLEVKSGSSGNTTFSGGNVGVGTTLPSTLLEVGAQKFNVLTGGNVGVGSISPGATLDVVGTIRVVNTNSVGWSVVAGANTACNTTCTTGCVFGFDTGLGGSDLVDCADATADRCLCAGAN